MGREWDLSLVCRGVLGWCQTGPGAEAALGTAVSIQNAKQQVRAAPVPCVSEEPIGLRVGNRWDAPGGTQRRSPERYLAWRMETMWR